MTLEDFFKGRGPARDLFEAILALLAGLDRCEMRITKSQIAFRRARDFAWIWCPDRYLQGHRVAPLVLSLSLPARDPSPRWKQIVEPAPGRFMHHLELHAVADVDGQVRDWLQQAYDRAGAQTSF